VGTDWKGLKVTFAVSYTRLEATGQVCAALAHQTCVLKIFRSNFGSIG
jgi:hypothetical protein